VAMTKFALKADGGGRGRSVVLRSKTCSWCCTRQQITCQTYD